MLSQIVLNKVSKKSEKAILDLIFGKTKELKYKLEPLNNFTKTSINAEITGGCISVLAGNFGTKNQIGLLSYLGRINYSYNDRYLLSASFRADGSSYFGPGNKWGTFPSISLGWIATKEKFLSNIDWLSTLKFRGSYGISGNNRISDFAFLDLMYGANYSLGSGTGTSFPGLENLRCGCFRKYRNYP